MQSIFPKPGDVEQGMLITRGQLFGDAVFPDRNPDDVHLLPLESLREEPQLALQEMGLGPA